MAASYPDLTLRLVENQPLTAAEMDDNLSDLRAYTLAVETQILDGSSTFSVDVISGDKINGGVISNFASTGIDDNSNANALTIDSEEKATFAGAMEVTGVSTFTGALTASGGVVGNSDTATKIAVSDNESTDENNLIAFLADAGATTGNHALEMDGNLTYNPSTSQLTAPNAIFHLLKTTNNADPAVVSTILDAKVGEADAAVFTGNVTGDVTGDITGNVTATSVLADGVTATTQDHAAVGYTADTKVATTAHVDAVVDADVTTHAALRSSETVFGHAKIHVADSVLYIVTS